MADNDTFRYLGGLRLEGFLAYMCDWVCTTWETTGPELAVLKLSWPGAGGFFRVIFGVIFGVLFWLLFGPLLAPKMAPKTDPKPFQNVTFLRSIFGLLFWKVLELSRDLLGAFLGLLRLSWDASGSQKPIKNEGFLRFLEMSLFVSSKLLTALLGSSCGLLGPIRRQNGPQNGAQKWSKRGPKQAPKNDLKNDPKSADFGSHFGVPWERQNATLGPFGRLLAPPWTASWP